MRISSLCLVAALASCGKDTPKAREAPPTPTPTSNVQLFVDDAVVGTIAPDQVKLWPRVDVLVPASARHLGSWQELSLHSTGTKGTDLHQPTANYPDYVPALFPGADGKPAFGLFDPIQLSKHGAPAVRQDDVTEVRIKLSQGGSHGQNESGNAEIVDPKDLKITIKSPSGTTTLGGEKLMAVPRENMPGTDEPKGWTLATVLKTAGIDTYEKLLLTDQGGLNLTLEKQDLDPKVAIPYIKLNRQGSLRVKVYKKQGDGWEGTGDLRGLVAIEILQ